MEGAVTSADRAFVDRVTVTLELTIGTETFSVVGGDLKRFELDMECWGFSGRAEWYAVCTAAQSEDTLFASFVESDLMAMKITLSRTYDEVGETSASMSLQGLVTSKSVLERTFPLVSGEPVLQRKYAIEFADRGRVLWQQHRPVKLYVDSSLKQLIEDNKPDGVTTEYTWSAADTTHAVLSIGLGTPKSDATFYDFLFWLLHKQNVGLYYDTEENKYSFLDTKPESETSEELRRAEVSAVDAYFPHVRRDAVSVLNAYTDAATKKKDITNDQGVTGVRTDFLIRSSIASDLDDRATLETARAKQHEPEARVCLKSYPAAPFRPSMKIELGDDWSANVYQYGKTYRIASTRITANALSQEATDDNGEESNRYELQYELRLELESDPVFRYPAFKKPVWPFYVEGKVLSETGEDTEGTYQFYTDDTTSLDNYKVKIPLWDDLKVIVSFESGLMNGHFYFPLYRDARVLVALGFDKAEICACLDWRTGARLPLDTQGNQILVGKGTQDETYIRHVYEDAKPVLTIQRSKDTDLQTITVSEGTIRFETKDSE
jgi:hypothetical protein